MKKYPVFYIALCFVFMVIALPQCKKHTIPPARLNITLYDKPLDTIKSYISGKWKLEYTYGGYVANQRTDFHNKDYIWEIDSGVNIKQTFSGNLATDTLIEWEWQSRYTGVGAPTNTMKFFDKLQYPYVYVIIGIINDSLLLKDYGNADAVTYHFSKRN